MKQCFHNEAITPTSMHLSISYQVSMYSVGYVHALRVYEALKQLNW